MKRLTIIWLLLLALTLVVTLNPSGVIHHWVYYLVGFITLIKGWLIINDFMELKQAPTILRRLVQGWLTITTAAVMLSAVVAQ